MKNTSGHFWNNSSTLSTAWRSSLLSISDSFCKKYFLRLSTRHLCLANLRLWPLVRLLDLCWLQTRIKFQIEFLLIYYRCGVCNCIICSNRASVKWDRKSKTPSPSAVEVELRRLDEVWNMGAAARCVFAVRQKWRRISGTRPSYIVTLAGGY